MLHDVKQIEPTITHDLVRPMAIVNGMFREDRLPTFHYDTAEEVDKEKMVKVLTEGVNIGMKISLSQAHEILQIPMAEEGEDILTPSAKTPPPEEKEQEAEEDKEKRRQAALSQTPGTRQFTLESLTEEMVREGAKHEQEMLSQIYAVLSECSDFDEAIEKIGTLRLDLGKYAEVLGKGMMMANLAGRSDVKDGK
jgi:phage gp29-like protein